MEKMTMADEGGAAVDGETRPRHEEDSRDNETVPEGRPQWSRHWDERAGAFFFVDAVSGVCVWEQPEGFSDDGSGEVAEGVTSGSLDAVWVAQFDPTCGRTYYYNRNTGESQWDKPESFIEGGRDVKVDGAVKIQSAFRSKKARESVKQLRDRGVLTCEAATSGECASASTSRSQSALSDQSEGSGRVWRKHYDPRSQQYYYHNIETGESSWEKPSADEGVYAEEDTLGDSATRIQSAFRKKTAARSVETKRRCVSDLTSPEVIAQKLKDLKQAVDEIHVELDFRKRTLSIPTASPELHRDLHAWYASVTQIRDRALDFHHQAQLLQKLETGGSERVAAAERFHETIAATRAECLALLRSILLTDSQFVNEDVVRVNEIFKSYEKCKRCDIVLISDSAIRKVIQSEGIEVAIAQCERSLSKAMGVTDFIAGATTISRKTYAEWRGDAQAAVESVLKLEQVILDKRMLLSMYESNLIEKRERALMDIEDRSSKRQEDRRRKQEEDAANAITFVELCRQRWMLGLAQKRFDEEAEADRSKEAEMRKQREHERIQKLKTDDRERRKRIKLSIWEAVREGYSVDVIRAMIYAEMQKARQNGFDFLVRTAQSNRSETLVQIACWAGHEELVAFLLDEGADINAVDSFHNRFTLLHDAARRGHSQIIRLLIEKGLKQDLVDGSGDTPLHWAVRMNYYEAVHTLVGAYLHRADPDHTECALRAAKTKNHRGRTPIDLAKSDCMRRLLQAFEQGRIRAPYFIHRQVSTTSPQHQGRRMTEIPSIVTHSGSILAHREGKEGTQWKVHSSKVRPSSSGRVGSHQDRHHNQNEEDDFGVINLVSFRH